ncbi:unnamed protein product, partial [Staurois parvus]
MDTDRWHCWGYTDHQGTLIISALMISAHVPLRDADYRLCSPLELSACHAEGTCALMISV